MDVKTSWITSLSFSYWLMNPNNESHWGALSISFNQIHARKSPGVMRRLLQGKAVSCYAATKTQIGRCIGYVLISYIPNL